jgi:ribosomal protein S18 acetylase RimI-like enzyme
MIIRDAFLDEYTIIADFQKMMAKETENLELNDNIVKKGVKAVFENPEKGKYYVAEENGVVVASLLTTYEWSDWRNGTVLWIQSVYVMPDFRKSGVFKKMYSHIQEIVNSGNEFSGIRLYVDKTNVNAQKVYEKVGMNGEHYILFEEMK